MDKLAEAHRQIAELRAEARIAELEEVLRLCIPTNVCLTNRNVPDNTIVPLDVPMGDLRKISATLARRPAQ